MINVKKHQSFIPVVVSTVAGLAIITTGGGYLIKQQFTGQENKFVLGVKNKTANPFIYKSESVDNQNVNLPGFTINPPAGYTKQTNPNYKVLFFSSKKDEQRIANVGTYKLPARILVNILDLSSQSGFSELEKRADYSDDKMLKAIDAISIIDVKNSVVIQDTLTELAGQPCRILEYKASTLYGGKYEISEHVYMQLFIKNKYLVVASGGSLESAWKKRALEIKASLNTFSFIEQSN